MKRIVTSALLAAAFVAAPAIGFSATAAENWTTHCAKCHSADGKGKAKLKTKDYTAADVQKSFTDAQATTAIKDGIKEEGKKMPAYNEKLSAQEITDLVAFIRAMGPK
jgi:cytochrome c553